MLSKLPAVVNVNGSTTSLDCPAPSDVICADGPLGALGVSFHCTVAPNAVQVPLVMTCTVTVACCPAIGDGGLTVNVPTWRSAHTGTAAFAATDGAASTATGNAARIAGMSRRGLVKRMCPPLGPRLAARGVCDDVHWPPCCLWAREVSW